MYQLPGNRVRTFCKKQRIEEHSFPIVYIHVLCVSAVL